ncbi:MAG: hypothetical protein RLZZ490_2427 [Cyanobacteriota bacterium]
MFSGISRRVMAMTCTGLTLSLGTISLAQPAQADAVARAQGRCKLERENVIVFDGHCTAIQKQRAQGTVFVISLDNSSEFRFSGPNEQALQVETYDGLHNVTYQDKGDKGVFKWEADGQDNRLAVKVDSLHNPNASHDSNNAGSIALGALAGVAVGALIGGLLGSNSQGAAPAPATPVKEGDEVASLQDLVGAKGGQAEGTVIDRGFIFRNGEKLADSSFTYWSEPNTNNCVVIRTTDGRYASITYAAKNKCN